VITKEEILAMEAGYELDALVATRIMGWRRIRPGMYQWMWSANGKRVLYACSEWKPSTDISPAWQVVEKMLDLGFCIELYAPKPLATEWSVLYVTNVSRYQTDKVYAPEAPEAICKGALLAKLAKTV